MEKGSIFCFVDERLPQNLAAVAKKATYDAGIIYHDTPACFASSLPACGKRGSFFTNAGSIVRKSEFGTQRDASMILDSIQEHLNKSGRRTIFITVDDLTCKSQGHYLNFCFGLAQGSSIVISMVRFGKLPPEEQEIILTSLIMHELGHLYGLASRGTRANTVYNIGMHCTDRRCVMRQGVSVEKIRANFLYGEKCRMNESNIKLRYYCPLCAEEIEEYFKPRDPKSIPPLPPRRKAS